MDTGKGSAQCTLAQRTNMQESMSGNKFHRKSKGPDTSTGLQFSLLATATVAFVLNNVVRLLFWRQLVLAVHIVTAVSVTAVTVTTLVQFPVLAQVPFWHHLLAVHTP